MFKAILLALTIASAFATKGVDFSVYQGALSVSDLKCFSSNGVEFAIIQLWEGSGNINPYFKGNYDNAKSAGIKYVDAYAFVCDTFTGDQICAGVANNIPSGFDGQVWLDIEPSSGCWNKGNRVAFVDTVIQACKSRGLNMGVYSSLGSWESVMGSDSAGSSELRSLPLWYAHYDGSASFSDFDSVKFGGWSKPNMKQYAGDSSLCGIDVDLDFY